MKSWIYTYTLNVFICVSQLINALCGGKPDETLCSRAWRHHLRGRKRGTYTVKFFDTMFFWDKEHCKGSYESEINRYHMPKDIVEIQGD